MILRKSPLSALCVWLVFISVSILLPLLVCANRSSRNAARRSLFEVGWRDAYAYSHKWGYYRGYHESSAQRIENEEKKQFLLEKAQRAPPPKASSSLLHPRSNQYLKGWQVAHQKAAKMGYDKGWEAAQAGEPYNMRDDTYIVEPPGAETYVGRRRTGLIASVASLGTTSALVLARTTSKINQPPTRTAPRPRKTTPPPVARTPPPPPPPSKKKQKTKTDPSIHKPNEASSKKKKKDNSISRKKINSSVTTRIKRHILSLAVAIVLLDFVFWIYDSLTLLP